MFNKTWNLPCDRNLRAGSESRAAAVTSTRWMFWWNEKSSFWWHFYETLIQTWKQSGLSEVVKVACYYCCHSPVETLSGLRVWTRQTDVPSKLHLLESFHMLQGCPICPVLIAWWLLMVFGEGLHLAVWMAMIWEVRTVSRWMKCYPEVVWGAWV